MTWLKHSHPVKLFTVSALLVLFACPKFSFSQQVRKIDPEIQRQIDDYIQNEFLPKGGISSLGLSIVQNDGEVLYTTGYGLSNIEKGISTGNQTQFLIGSITKIFTSTVTVKLLNERFPEMGEAVLDTPIRQLLPEFDFMLIDRFRSEQVTFRDLLAHRTCLEPGNAPLLAGAFETLEEVAYYQRYSEEICEFRSDFQYNNQMYVYVGQLIAFLANKPYENAVEDFLRELRMENSTFIKVSDDFSQMPYRAQPYFMFENKTHLVNPGLIKRLVPALPAGGLFVTPNDMTKFMRFHLNEGYLHGRQIIPQDAMKWLTIMSNTIILDWYKYKKGSSDKVINQFGYGLGLVLSSYDGWQYIQHGGDFPPYHSLFSLYPTQNLSIFSCVNQSPSRIDRLLLHATIFEILKETENIKAKLSKLEKQIAEQKAEKKDTGRNQIQVFLQKHKKMAKHGVKREDITGKYGKGNLGEITVSERFNEHINQTQFYAEYGKWFTGWLDAVEEGVIYKFNLDTDATQEDMVFGTDQGLNYVIFEDDLLHLVKMLGTMELPQGTFKLGVNFDQLPSIPWAPGSC